MRQAIAMIDAPLWGLCAFGALLLLSTGIYAGLQGLLFPLRYPSLGAFAGINGAVIAVVGVLAFAAIPWWIVWCTRMIRE